MNQEAFRVRRFAFHVPNPVPLRTRNAERGTARAISQLMAGALWLPLTCVILAAPSSAVVQPCPIEGNCVEITVRAPAAPVATGETFGTRILFQQGSDDGMAGGVDQIAALSLTIGIEGLELADCTPPGSDGLNPSFSVLGNLSRYRVVVQNLSCATRASCLCPASGTPDRYINLLLIGIPNAQGVQSLPSGALLDIALRARPGSGPRIPLHVYSALDDPSAFPLPAGGALLSIGDRLAIDRTIKPSAETINVRITESEVVVVNPTASATAMATATATTASATETVPVPLTVTATVPPATATATVAASHCPGDCNGSGEVTINELLTGVSIALGSMPVSICEVFDCAGTGTVEVACLIAAVNASLNGCPHT
jgi:hypothetical protein